MSAEGAKQPSQTRSLFGSSFMGPIPRFWVLLILVGVVLTIAGTIAVTSAGYFITPNPPPQGGTTCDRIQIRNITLTGSIAAQAGLLLLTLGFFGAGAASPDLDRGLRIALFIGGVLILVFPFSIFRVTYIPNTAYYC